MPYGPDFLIASFPLELVKKIRARHDVPYHNDRAYDYAMGPDTDVAAIPYCLNRWANEGLRLDRSFVEELWTEIADKRGNTTGELHRCAKLVLDAYRHVYDIAALTAISNVNVRYTPADDIHGIDYRVHHPRIGQIAVQLSVSVSSADYRTTKTARRIARGTNGQTVIELRAYRQDIDQRYQPFVPTDNWYQRVPYQLLDVLEESA